MKLTREDKKTYCGAKIELRYGSTACGNDFHGERMQCDRCKGDSVHVDKPLAESAVAPGECGSVPDEQIIATWEEAQRISDLPAVDECLRGFAEDHTGDNATCLVREVLRAIQSGMQPPNTVERDLDCSTPTAEQPREVLIQRLEACQQILTDERAAFDALVIACQRALSHYERIRGDKEDTALMTNLRSALRLAGAA